MTGATPILELRSVRGTGGGPDKTILLGTSRMDARFPTTVCYLRDERDRTFHIDERARQTNVAYVEIRERHSFDWRVWPALRRVCRERSIRIVHAHDYKTDVLAFLLSKAEGVIPLATAHGWTGHSWRERVMYYPGDKWVLKHFPRVIAVSEQLRQELIADGADPRRVVTILNGIDDRAFRRDPAKEHPVRTSLGLQADDIVIGAVGRLEPQKRFDILLDVCAILAKTRPSLKLLVVGDGSLRSALTAQVAALGLQDRCRFLGQRADVADLHHAFDLLVQSSDYEGTPNAVLEAMALETPVVATNVGGTAEIARPDVDALIVPPRDPVALRAAIEASFSDSEGARARAVRARQRVVNHLSFDARMAALERVYQELADAPERKPSPAV
jgi:glycosyltransferase involved in cell wall biosynthesis